MIRFKRQGTKVIIEIEHGINPNPTHFFSREITQDYDYQAELLKDAMQKNLNNHLKQIKHDAYMEGWRDAKAKKRKRVWDDFWGGWKF